MTEFEFNVQNTKQLRTLLLELKKKCDELIKKMDKEKLSTDHSINSDIFDLATRIFKISAVMGYIKNFNLELNNLQKE
tara:strand:- start:55 stop:288 length:234 start_codon:yes stop_codon:yes gene_type:complete